MRISLSTLDSAFSDGRAKGKKAMILNMHRLNRPLEEIAAVAELSMDEVENIVHLAK